jgi:hypothetical protein
VDGGAARAVASQVLLLSVDHPGGRLRAGGFRISPIASGGNVLQLRLFALVRTHNHNRAKLFTSSGEWQSSAGQRFHLITHTFDSARHPSLPGFPGTVGCPMVSTGHSRTTAWQLGNWATGRMTASSIAGCWLLGFQFSPCCPTCPQCGDQSRDDPG